MGQINAVTPKKWALITGASSGIGEAFAHRIAAEGYNLVLVARREDRLKEIAQKITNDSGVDAVTFARDLHHKESVEQLMGNLAARGIPVDVFFNNAGYGLNGEFCELDITKQLEMIDLNCKAVVMLSHQIGQQMKARMSGSIIHTASLGGLAPTPFYSTYGATKAFIVSFSEALSEELRPHGVRIFTLCPGATETEFERTSNFRGIRPAKVGFESAIEVAETAVRALKGSKSLIISGRQNQFAACVMRSLPRRLSLRWAAKSLKPRQVINV